MCLDSRRQGIVRYVRCMIKPFCVCGRSPRYWRLSDSGRQRTALDSAIWWTNSAIRNFWCNASGATWSSSSSGREDHGSRGRIRFVVNYVWYAGGRTEVRVLLFVQLPSESALRWFRIEREQFPLRNRLETVRPLCTSFSNTYSCSAVVFHAIHPVAWPWSVQRYASSNLAVKCPTWCIQ